MRYDVISQYGDRSILLVSVTRLADPQDSGNIVLVSLLTNQEQGLPFRELYWQIRNKAYFPISVLTNEEQGFPFRELCWLIRNKAYFQISVLTNQEQGLPFRELYWPIRNKAYYSENCADQSGTSLTISSRNFLKARLFFFCLNQRVWK